MVFSVFMPMSSDVQDGFRKGRGTRYQIANIHWIIEKAREFQKNIYFCFIDYAKAFDCVDHNKLENSSRDGNTDHLTCLLKYCMQVKKQQLEMDMEEQTHLVPNWETSTSGCILSPYIFNIYAE